MTPTFDAAALLETCRTAFAPALRAQQEGVKTLETLARHQLAVASDYLDWSIAQARAVVGAASPAELMTKQAELNSQFGEQLRNRADELVKLTAKAQDAFRQFVTEAGAKAAAATAKGDDAARAA